MKTAVKVERSELDKYYLKRMSKKLTLGLKTALYTHCLGKRYYSERCKPACKSMHFQLVKLHSNDPKIKNKNILVHFSAREVVFVISTFTADTTGVSATCVSVYPPVLKMKECFHHWLLNNPWTTFSDKSLPGPKKQTAHPADLSFRQLGTWHTKHTHRNHEQG